LSFLTFAKVKTVSALHGSGISELLNAAADADTAAGRTLPTPQLNQVLQDAVIAHTPPVVRGRRIRLRYAHQGGRRPPVIVLHGSQVTRLPDHYRRYLINTFRKVFRLEGTPIRLELKQGDNPFAGRRNVLTPRQQRKRDRLLKHTKRR
jgi:GTP-binding protein